MGIPLGSGPLGSGPTVLGLVIPVCPMHVPRYNVARAMILKKLMYKPDRSGNFFAKQPSIWHSMYLLNERFVYVQL